MEDKENFSTNHLEKIVSNEESCGRIKSFAKKHSDFLIASSILGGVPLVAGLAYGYFFTKFGFSMEEVDRSLKSGLPIASIGTGLMFGGVICANKDEGESLLGAGVIGVETSVMTAVGYGLGYLAARYI
jgi:hypothetical protein